MKKILLITYYWPPSGGSGVQRWLNFTKYLSEFDIEPIVYTVSNPNYAIEDLSLKASQNLTVIKQPIWEPYQLATLFTGKNMKETSSGFLDQSKSVKTKIVNYIRANFFIPDARKYWVKPSVRFLKKYLAANHINTIITSGPPHSLHLIGLELQDALGIKWIADFRDPWTQIDYFHQLPFTKKNLKKHFELEKKVAQNANAILVVGETMRDYYANFNHRVFVISNGFEPTEIDVDIKLDKKFSLTHIGLLNADRNSDLFWEVVRELIDENSDFKTAIHIKLIGKVADEVKTSVLKQGLDNIVDYIDYVPHHQVQQFQKESQVLLLLVNRVPNAKGIVTGKIFEYLLAKRPVLAIGPVDGDLAKIINHTKSGTIADFSDKEGIKTCLLSYFNAYQNKTLAVQTEHLNDFHVKTICGKLAEIIKT